MHNKDESELLAIGKLLSNQQLMMQSDSINDFEFKIFSQYGDDGIIQYLIRNLNIQNETFIEFGVEDYSESNTRFLMMNNNWTGYVLDGSAENIKALESRNWLWKYDLRCKAVFIDRDNINALLADSHFTNIGILSIDIDGNDYHILSALDLSMLNPAILIVEYNSNFGMERFISIPYQKDFNRTQAHFSNLYWGASLSALTHEAKAKGYSLVCCNNAGNNAYFVRTDLINDKVKIADVDKAYRISRFRESRDHRGKLTYLRSDERMEAIRGLDVINTLTGTTEKL